jgi:hypothetical protein
LRAIILLPACRPKARYPDVIFRALIPLVRLQAHASTYFNPLFITDRGQMPENRTFCDCPWSQRTDNKFFRSLTPL